MWAEEEIRQRCEGDPISSRFFVVHNRGEEERGKRRDIPLGDHGIEKVKREKESPRTAGRMSTHPVVPNPRSTRNTGCIICPLTRLSCKFLAPIRLLCMISATRVLILHVYTGSRTNKKNTSRLQWAVFFLLSGI